MHETITVSKILSQNEPISMMLCRPSWTWAEGEQYHVSVVVPHNSKGKSIF